jgi:hypothetical protein
VRLTRLSEDRQTISHTISYLGALADQGQETVPIRKVMELLGVTWREASTGTAAPPPGVDPITGCAPVTAVQARGHL